jgi:hypothetical protein
VIRASVVIALPMPVEISFESEANEIPNNSLPIGYVMPTFAVASSGVSELAKP